jgi:glutathionyl-hydroquinone reductase
VRLWPTLARFDLGYNPLGKISERRLVDFPALADWDEPHHRERLR